LVDADRLVQIVDNLLANAVSYGRSPIRVTTRQVGDEVEVSVHDEGPGVPPELRERLFQRFASQGGHGTGLGLHIVQELARAQGGDVAYVAEDNAFVVRLPRAASDP
jgi:signal transduction histidine kinase